MRAAVYHGPRDVRIESVPEPPDPGLDEIAIQVERAAICGTDAGEFAHGPQQIPLTQRHPASGHVGPVILGHEFVGRVSALGDEVSGFQLGDRVVSGAGVSCGRCSWCRDGRTNLCASYYTLGLQANGGLSRVVNSPARICVGVPAGCHVDAAAIAQPMAVASHALDRGNADPDTVLAVIGVGGIGALIVAAAHGRGIRDLIAIDVDAERLYAARSLGADHTVHARTSDTVEAVRELTEGIGADVVIEASGAPDSPGSAIRATRRGGRVVIVGLQKGLASIDLYDAAMREIEITTSLAHVCDSDLPASLELLTSSDVGTHAVDRVVPLAGMVEEGMVPLVEGRVAGKVVVEVEA
jgi:(R,R)-butanediol dehydrogenase/meso-butanediol dehydrogenase/diacetyl reductase